MKLPWRWRLAGLFAVITAGLSLYILLSTLSGPVPDEWWYALTVYVAGPLGFPWSLFFRGWGIIGGILINAAILFALGWVLDLRISRLTSASS